MKTPVHIKHIVGHCPVCMSPILDAGWTDDPSMWSHAIPMPTWLLPSKRTHNITFGGCAMRDAIQPTTLWPRE